MRPGRGSRLRGDPARAAVPFVAAACLALATSCAIAQQTVAPPAMPSAAAATERFTATLTTRETFRFDRKRCPEWPHLAGTTVAEGGAVPYGPVVGRGSDCVRPTSARTFAFTHGKLTMTTAAGDELRADYDGRLDRSPKLRFDHVVGAFVVTGGTGRFAGAAGQGTIDGSENLLTRRGRLVFDGVIRR